MTQTSSAMPEEQQTFHSTWLQGSKAARAGKQPSDCPYIPESYKFVAWFNGWSFTMYQIKQEEEL